MLRRESPLSRRASSPLERVRNASAPNARARLAPPCAASRKRRLGTESSLRVPRPGFAWPVAPCLAIAPVLDQRDSSVLASARIGRVFSRRLLLVRADFDG